MALIGVITNVARSYLAIQAGTGLAFIVDSFTAGTEGHDPGNPLTALTPDPAATEVAGQIFGPKAVVGFTLPSPTCPVWDIQLTPSEAVGANISSFGLWATILDLGTHTSGTVGDTFLYALIHQEQLAKTASTWDLELGVQMG